MTAFASYGDPRTDDPLWWIGEGDATNVGLTFGYNYFLADDFALLAEFTPLRRYSQDGETIHAIEFQLGFRGFFWSADLSGPSKIGLFFDVAGGFMAANARVPDRGTKSNLTADFGPECWPRSEPPRITGTASRSTTVSAAKDTGAA